MCKGDFPSDFEKLRLLRIALQRGLLDFNDVIEKCRTGEMQFWDAKEACAVTSIGISGDFKVMYVVGVGGTLAGCQELAILIDTKAREYGCTHVVTEGRLGFEKVYKDIDPEAKRVATRYVKTL